MLDYFTKDQGKYTAEDYHNLPKGINIELLDGLIFDKVSPSKEHRHCAEYFYSMFKKIYKELGDLSVNAFISSNIQLDEKTVVTPDLFCIKEYVVADTHIIGIPNFVIEILSRDTVVRDSLYKLHKYKEVGVKEYWMIDLANKRIYIHNFVAGVYMIKSFEESHTIMAFDSVCDVQFYDMYQYIKGKETSSEHYDNLNLLGFRENLIPYFEHNPKLHNADDCLVYPDVIRVELINGVIYDLAAPTIIHQAIISHLMFKLRLHIKTNEGLCMPFVSPAEVCVGNENKDLLQPDLFVVCNRDIVTQKRIEGAPDFIVEVLSMSSITKDKVIKLNKYNSVGTKEYWVIDPFDKVVHAWNFQKNSYETKSFDESHDITIFDPPCTIDFKEMYKEIEFIK